LTHSSRPPTSTSCTPDTKQPRRPHSWCNTEWTHPSLKPLPTLSIIQTKSFQWTEVVQFPWFPYKLERVLTSCMGCLLHLLSFPH
jgi:hypothetical protein